MRPIRRSAIALFLLISCLAAMSVGQNSPAPAANAQPAQTPMQASSSDQANDANNSLSPEAEDKLIREVRHELIMLPYYGVFDNLEFRVDGRTVTLQGQVTRPVLKSDAENVVKRIEGVEKVVNNIEVLPPSPMDDRIRRAVYNSIYTYGPLFKYANMTVPPIHIIVKNGRITLTGVVDSEQDKNMAGMRANMVPGTFQVTNNLRVVNSSNSGKK